MEDQIFKEFKDGFIFADIKDRLTSSKEIKFYQFEYLKNIKVGDTIWKSGWELCELPSSLYIEREDDNYFYYTSKDGAGCIEKKPDICGYKFLFSSQVAALIYDMEKIQLRIFNILSEGLIDPLVIVDRFVLYNNCKKALLNLYAKD